MLETKVTLLVKIQLELTVLLSIGKYLSIVFQLLSGVTLLALVLLRWSMNSTVFSSTG